MSFLGRLRFRDPFSVQLQLKPPFPPKLRMFFLFLGLSNTISFRMGNTPINHLGASVSSGTHYPISPPLPQTSKPEYSSPTRRTQADGLPSVFGRPILSLRAILIVCFFGPSRGHRLVALQPLPRPSHPDFFRIFSQPLTLILV